MFVTTHVAAGALLGNLLPDSVALAGVAGVVSHFAFDALPHWLPGAPVPFLPAAVADGLVALALVAAAARRHERPAVLAAMLGAALPDLDKPAVLAFGRSPFPRRFDALHKAVQWERQSGAALGREVLVAAVGAVALGRRLAERRTT